MMVFKKELIAFTLLCILLSAFLGFAFFKRPGLLGNDFVQIQKELMKMVRKKKGKRSDHRIRQRLMEEQKNDLANINE